MLQSMSISSLIRTTAVPAGMDVVLPTMNTDMVKVVSTNNVTTMANVEGCSGES